MNGFKEMLLNIFLNFMQSFDANIGEAANILTSGNIFGGSAYSTMTAITSALKPVCLIIIMIAFLIEMFKMAMQVDALKWEMFFKVLAKLVISKVIIDIAPDVLETLYLTASEWTSAAVSASGGAGSTLGGTAATQVERLFLALTWQQALGLVASMLIPFLAIMLCGLIIKIMAYGRMFELYVYIAVSPLPCAFFPLEDGSGGHITMKYFKSFFAVCLQGLFMIICMKVFDALIAQALLDAMASVAIGEAAAGINGIVYNLFVGAACLTIAITKCGGWAKSILDVN